jgi:hypothetical protein
LFEELFDEFQVFCTEVSIFIAEKWWLFFFKRLLFATGFATGTNVQVAHLGAFMCI